MKRALMMIIMILLCACTEVSVKDLKNPISEISGFELQEMIKTYLLENGDLKKNYYMGNGIRTLSLTGNMSEGKTDVFPVYCEDQPILLLIHRSDNDLIAVPEKALKCISENNNYLIVETEENIYYLSKDEILLIDGDENYGFSEAENKILDKVRANIEEENIMGKDKAIIKMLKPIDGQDSGFVPSGMFANDHIVIRFVEGNREEQIKAYEEFCHGKVQSGINTSDVYIFEFSALSDADIQKLVDDSNALDYVEAASLDKINEIQLPGLSKE